MDLLTDQERIARAESFINEDLSRVIPDFSGQASTLEEFQKFLNPHKDLITLLHSEIASKFVDSIVDESTAAKQELRALGVDPELFVDAVTLAATGIANIWDGNNV